MNYYIAIPDIHGDIFKLNFALETCNAWVKFQRKFGIISKYDTIQYVFLGDYIDRGNHSGAVLKKIEDYVINRNAICLLGNHDMFIIGTAEDTSILLDNKLIKWSDLWEYNDGIITCKDLFGVVFDNHYNISSKVSDWREKILNSEYYSFLKKYGKTRYSTNTIFFSHAPLSDIKNIGDSDLLWGKSSDFGNQKKDTIFKVPEPYLVSVHGHYNRLDEGINFPRFHNYIHSGVPKTVVLADSGCGYSGIGELHPVVIGENDRYTNICAIL